MRPILISQSEFKSQFNPSLKIAHAEEVCKADGTVPKTNHNPENFALLCDECKDAFYLHSIIGPGNFYLIGLGNGRIGLANDQGKSVSYYCPSCSAENEFSCRTVWYKGGKAKELAAELGTGFSMMILFYLGLAGIVIAILFAIAN